MITGYDAQGDFLSPQQLVDEIERLRAEIQQHNDARWAGLKRAKDVRNHAIEECAEVAEWYAIQLRAHPESPTAVLYKSIAADSIAAAIRALKDKP